MLGEIQWRFSFAQSRCQNGIPCAKRHRVRENVSCTAWIQLQDLQLQVNRIGIVIKQSSIIHPLASCTVDTRHSRATIACYAIAQWATSTTMQMCSPIETTTSIRCRTIRIAVDASHLPIEKIMHVSGPTNHCHSSSFCFNLCFCFIQNASSGRSRTVASSVPSYAIRWQ